MKTRGGMARSRVPSEFIPQQANVANPPTMLLAIDKIIDTIVDEENEFASSAIKNLYPRLQTWHSWLLESQVIHR
jgi:hypothetical protein